MSGAGEKKTVRIPVRIEDLAYWDTERDEWVVEQANHEVYVGPHQRELLLSATFEVGVEGVPAE